MKLFRYTSKRWKIAILIFSVLLAVVALVQVNNIIVQIQNSEKEKIKLWVNAISRKAELVSHTETFFKTVRDEERSRMTLLTEAQQAFMELPLGLNKFCPNENSIPSFASLPAMPTLLAKP